MSENHMEERIQQTAMSLVGWQLAECVLLGLVRRGVLNPDDAREIVGRAIDSSLAGHRTLDLNAVVGAEYAAGAFFVATTHLKDLLQHPLLKENDSP